jgi:hypothetical protein
MLCVHLRELEQAIQARGIRETSRGQAWSENCREWVYFDCYLEREEIRRRFRLEACVKDHEHWGTHDGQEAGFYCEVHKDGIMGVHGRSEARARICTFPGTLEPGASEDKA